MVRGYRLRHGGGRARPPEKFSTRDTALLIREAERIARGEHRSKKIAVISGVGTRHYYRKLGYELEGPYMVESLVGQRGGRG